jgi:hypothetical protein
MSLRSRVLPAVCLALLVTIGCGGDPPEKEMQQAQGALDAARAAGADKYAAEEFTAATLALTNAKEAVEQRDYRLALNHALDSRERAQNAAAQAADGKAAARVAAEREIGSAEKALSDADNRLKAAEAAKVTPRLLAGPKQTIDTARTGVQEARAALDKGDYLDAPARAKAATASLPAALSEIEAATTATQRHRR